MPLFEIEEGPHHKFYRVERIGKRLELHWGRIGTAGQKKTLELGSEHEARREYELEVARRRERGYRQVIDEAAPRDSDEARQHKLAATGTLTKYPRFVFRKRELITWLEVRGNVLVTASGTTGPPTQKQQTFDTEQAALRERDRMMAELVGKGYVLDEFGAAEAPVAKRRAGKLGELKHHPELEAQLEAAPDDPNAWLVFEDWLLDSRDPRAAIIEHERSGDVTAAAQARYAIKKLLFGGRGATFDTTLSSATWRAGYVRTCELDATGARGRHRIAELVSAPAAKFLTELDLEVSDFAELSELAPAKLLGVLRVRHDMRSTEANAQFDAKRLEPFGRLSDLEIHRMSAFESAPCMARVRRLVLEYTRDADFGKLGDHELTKLESLRIDVVNESALQLARPLAEAMPALRSLELGGWGRGFALVEQAIASRLVSQLTRLVITDGDEPCVLEPEDRERVFAGAFVGVAYVQLPKSLVK